MTALEKDILTILTDDARISAKGFVICNSVNSRNAGRVIQDGANGDDVTRLQDHLRDLGYFNQKSTGKFRSVTQKSVRHSRSAA